MNLQNRRMRFYQQVVWMVLSESVEYTGDKSIRPKGTRWTSNDTPSSGKTPFLHIRLA